MTDHLTPEQGEWMEDALAVWKQTCLMAHATAPDPVDFRAGYRAALDSHQAEGPIGITATPSAMARIQELVAEVERLQEALRKARADVIGTLNAGFDSTRREVATRAIERIDAALNEKGDGDDPH